MNRYLAKKIVKTELKYVFLNDVLKYHDFGIKVHFPPNTDIKTYAHDAI